MGSYFSDRQTQSGTIEVPAGANPDTHAGRRDTGGPDYVARLNQLFGSFGIFTFQYSHHEDRNLVTLAIQQAPYSIPSQHCENSR